MGEKTPIREICEQYGLTQAALAQRFNIPLRTVEDWAAGKRKPPDYVVAMIKRTLELEEGAYSVLIDALKRTPVSEEDRKLARQIFSLENKKPGD